MLPPSKLKASEPNTVELAQSTDWSMAIVGVRLLLLQHVHEYPGEWAFVLVCISACAAGLGVYAFNHFAKEDVRVAKRKRIARLAKTFTEEGLESPLLDRLADNLTEVSLCTTCSGDPLLAEATTVSKVVPLRQFLPQTERLQLNRQLLRNFKSWFPLKMFGLVMDTNYVEASFALIMLWTIRDVLFDIPSWALEMGKHFVGPEKEVECVQMMFSLISFMNFGAAVCSFCIKKHADKLVLIEIQADSSWHVIFSAEDHQALKSDLEAHIKSASIWSKIITFVFALLVCYICGAVDSINAFSFMMVRFYPFAWFASGVFVPIVELDLSITDKTWQMMIEQMYSFKSTQHRDMSIENAQEVDITWQRLNLWLQHLTVHTKDLWASIFISILAMTVVVVAIVIVHAALSYVAHSTKYMGPCLVAGSAGIWTTGHFLYGLRPIAELSDMLNSIDDTVSHHDSTTDGAGAGTSKHTLHGAVLRNNCVPMTEQEHQGFWGFMQTLSDLKQRKALGIQFPLVGLISKETIRNLLGLLSGIIPTAFYSMIYFLN
jgi:hypothetical protein